MTLYQTIKDKQLQARKDKSPLKGVLTLLVSDIEARAKEAKTEPTDELALTAVRKQIKIIKDQAEYAHDFELEFGDELAMLEGFLPKQLTDDQLDKEILSQIALMPEAGMGPVIGALRGRLGESVDSKRLAVAVREHF